jgi:hypothetical protein
MNWNSGFSALYYASFVDPLTWRSIDRFEIMGGSISRKPTGLRQSANIDCKEYDAGERWIRIHLIARQGNDSENVPLFTGLASCPDDDIDGFYITNQVELYSVLKPAEDVLLKRGYYVQGGANVAMAIRNLLIAVTPAPVRIEGESPYLQKSIIAEDGESHLSMAEKILTAINWRIVIDGNGEIIICPKASEPVATFDPLQNDIIEPKIKRSEDWYSCPNVFRAISNGASAVARDDNPDSPLSTVTRGREIWMEESSVNLNQDESLAQYASRRLKEEQRVAITASYDRRYRPNINVSDIITLNYPYQKLTGNFLIESQSIELGYGASTSEEVTSV